MRSLHRIAPMGTAQSRPAQGQMPGGFTTESPSRIPVVKFRVLVIGRANAGKTSILQRVCETTESPTIHREGKEVVIQRFVYESNLTADRLYLPRQWMLVTAVILVGCLLTRSHCSEACTGLMTSLCSPITRVMFFMIPRESRLVTNGHSRS